MSINHLYLKGTQVTITIDKEKCTGCGFCREVCPMIKCLGFQSLEDPDSRYICLKCGHCMAICSREAIRVGDLAPVIPIGDLPTERQALDLVRTRRSVRGFKPQRVSRGDWEKLVEAIKYAPTGHNTQGVALMIVESAEILNKISDVGMELLKSMSHVVNKPVLRHIYKRLMGKHTYATVSRLLLLTNLQQEMVERGDDPILFHAPALMLFLTRKSEQMGQVEADLAAQTMALYAPTLGLGTCYAGIVMLAFSGAGASSKIKKFVNLPKGYTVSNALMVGYAEHRYRNIPDRKALNVVYL